MEMKKLQNEWGFTLTAAYNSGALNTKGHGRPAMFNKSAPTRYAILTPSPVFPGEPREE